tara:strand:- start:1162 stop:1755 length:594 start_codon:yes stop_codon:yes gene_type:complete
MATLLTPTTELEAVNVCLANIGESPVSAITGDITVDAAIARDLLRQVTREVQTTGFYWNTEIDYYLIPNTTGNLVLPANIISVDTVGKDKSKDLVARGRLLYDRVKHTYTFTDKVLVNLVVALGFEELPQICRHYIAIRSARVYQERVMGSGSVSNFNLADEQQARAGLLAENMEIEDNNMLTGDFSVSGILSRTAY